MPGRILHQSADLVAKMRERIWKWAMQAIPLSGRDRNHESNWLILKRIQASLHLANLRSARGEETLTLESLIQGVCTTSAETIA